jgi:chromosome segregation ATPase
LHAAARRSLLEQELQRFGDEKELAVKKTEREIRALRSTLERLNSKNQRFKQSFTKVEGDSEDMAEMEQLQPVLEAVSDRRRQARTEVEHLSGDVASMQGSLGNLMQETASIDRQVLGLRKRVESVQVRVSFCVFDSGACAREVTQAYQAEVSEHSGKVDRARLMEKKMTESFRKRVQATPGVVTAEEEDIKLQGFKESVNELLAAVLATVEDNPELKGKVCVCPCVHCQYLLHRSVSSRARADATPPSGARRAVSGWHIRAVAAAQRQRERAWQRRRQREVGWIAGLAEEW